MGITNIIRKISLIVLICCLLVSCGSGEGGSGEDNKDDVSNDTSQVSGGIVLTDFGTTVEAGRSVVLQPDGKILLAGWNRDDTQSDVSLVRYNSNGSLDTSFSDDGKLTTSINTTDYGMSAALQIDGKILVAGSSEATHLDSLMFTLVRYNSDGSLDANFDGDGIVTTAIGSEDEGTSVIVQADGKILLAGYSFNGVNNDFALVRYNSDGSLDATFSGDGILTTDVGSEDDYGRSVSLQSDGKILVAGESKIGLTNVFTLVRYKTDGSLDTSFDGDGIVTTLIGSVSSRGQSVTVQTDGKILVTGVALILNSDIALVRYNSDGSLDTSFSGDGIVTIDFSMFDWGNSVTVQADGKILVVGGADSWFESALVRYNSDGSLDTTFSGDGIITTVNGFDGRSVVVQADNKILVGGSGFDNDGHFLFELARFNSDGSYDYTFGL